MADVTALKPLIGDISLSITSGEVIGLVGDEDSGALQVAECIAGVLPAPACIRAGSILFNGVEQVGLSQRPPLSPRESQIAYWPRSSRNGLDATLTVGTQVVTALRTRFGLTKAAANKQSLELLRLAGDQDAPTTLAAYPRELSPLLTQRVQLAHALAANPTMLIADNPTANLTVSEGADLLSLLSTLQRQRGLTVIIVTPSVSVAALICQRVAVVRAGEIVEHASVADLVTAPNHPYTRELLYAAELDLPGGQAL